MILTFTGLLLSFIGSFLFAYDKIKSLNEPKAHYLSANPGLGSGNKKLEPVKPWGYKTVSYTMEEKKLALNLVLIALGFLLQIIGLFF